MRLRRRLVGRLEAAQIEPQGLLGHAADHRPRQGAQRRIQALEAAAPALDGADGEPVARQPVDGKGATADLTEHRRVGHLISLAERVLQQRPQPRGLRPHLCGRSHQQPQRRQPLGEKFRGAIQRQYRLQGGERQLAHPQGALERIPAQLADQIAAADEQPRLRSAEQLVAAEGDQIRPRRHGFAHRRFPGQLPARQVQQRAAAEIHCHRHGVRAAELDELRQRDTLGEAADGVVAGVDLHQQGGARTQGCGVIREVGAIGGAHFDELGARAPHDVGKPERAADLDELPARDQHLAPIREHAQHQQHGGRVVVHDHGRFGAGELAQQLLDQRITLATPAGFQIELQIYRRGQRLRHGTHGLLGQQRAAEIGVQHRTGEIEHRPEREARGICQRRPHGSGDRVPGEAGTGKSTGERGVAQTIEAGAQRRDDLRASVLRHQRLERARVQQSIDRGNVGRVTGFHQIAHFGCGHGCRAVRAQHIHVVVCECQVEETLSARRSSGACHSSGLPLPR